MHSISVIVTCQPSTVNYHRYAREIVYNPTAMGGDNRLAQWIIDNTGTGKRFKSIRFLSKKAGLNQNTVNGTAEGAMPRCDTIVALARASGEPATKLFALWAGLPEEEGAEETDLDREVKNLSDQYRRLRPDRRGTVLEVLEGFLEQTTQEE